MTNYKVTTRRSANAVQANPTIFTSLDGLRRVYGRNVKRSIGNHRFDVVRVYRLAEYRGGKWTTITSQTGWDAAEKFLTEFNEAD